MRKSTLSEESIAKDFLFYQDTREKLLAVLKMILGGDAIASEYLLISLLSKIHNRQTDLLLGNLSVNLTNLTPNDAKALTTFIRNITPLTNYLPLTIDSLENLKLSPHKNYDTNSLEGGLLQMMDGTIVIVDETNMKEGQIKEKGILNIKTLATLIE